MTVSLGDVKYTTQVGIGLDPEWEEETFFEIADPETDKIGAEFFIKCEKNGNEQMLGDRNPTRSTSCSRASRPTRGSWCPAARRT